MQILNIAVEKGISVYAIKRDWKLDYSIQSKTMAIFFVMTAEIERDLISKRTKKVLKSEKAAGMKLG